MLHAESPAGDPAGTEVRTIFVLAAIKSRPMKLKPAFIFLFAVGYVSDYENIFSIFKRNLAL